LALLHACLPIADPNQLPGHNEPGTSKQLRQRGTATGARSAGRWNGFARGAGSSSPWPRRSGRTSPQRILRHSQIAMTIEVCAAASDDEVRAALGKLSDAMGGTG
jgi:hypothetical protein